MKEMNASHRGSALIIVLGMLSFMVVSAVGFSIYMRASRLPSSYLRRSVSTRYLLKSALANAIERLDGRYASYNQIRSLTKSADPEFTGIEEDEEIDDDDRKNQSGGSMEGICDDPYPGVGPRLQGEAKNPNLSDAERAKKLASALRKNGGYFTHHVFTPFGPVDRSQTVTTLTLEGLAYLPPALINEARVYSRMTRTACWRNLSYESGRYAFCAIDVSDMFDVNKVDAEPRTSAPNSRIGFSSLFLSGSNWSDINKNDPFSGAVDKVFGQGDGGDALMSFLSMADFNLLMYRNGDKKFSPFCQYVDGGGSVPQIQKSDINDPLARNALFITDTWFPPTNSLAPPKFVLAAGGQNQPFTEFDRSWGAEAVMKEIYASGIGKCIRDRLGGIGSACLYDYLDRDNIPVSFALPTVETAAMVCGLGVEAREGLKTRISRNDGNARNATVASADPAVEIELKATPYEFSWGSDAIHLTGLATFPFKRVKHKGTYATKFKVSGLVRVFLAPDDLQSRINADSPLLLANANDWKKGRNNGIVTLQTEEMSVSFDNDLPSAEDAVKRFETTVDLDDSAITVFWEVQKTTFKADPQTGARTQIAQETYYSMDGVTVSTSPLETYDKAGRKETWLDDLRKAAKPAMFEPGAKLSAADQPTKAADAGKNIHDGRYVPHVAVWMKVVNDGGPDSGKVVDFVPACLRDDKTWANHEVEDNELVTTLTGGDNPPILRTSGKVPFAYGASAQEALNANAGELSWKSLYVIEPRYNHAPEAWYNAGGEPKDLKPENWIASISPLLGQNGRDHDIFMFTSDQEYLQSMGELQFLPWTHDLTVNLGGLINKDDCLAWNNAWNGSQGRDAALSFIETRGEMKAWQTYSAYEGDPVYNLGDRTLEIVSSSGDFRVNPFSSDRRVLMSVFANTPYDYAVASTNPACNIVKDEFPDYDFTLNHAFNSKTQCAKLTDQVRDGASDAAGSELEQLVDGFREEMRLQVTDDWNGSAKNWPEWENIYDDLGWLGSFNQNGESVYSPGALFGVSLQQPLHEVDRKFLYSFWRECFQNRQQLFLVFLRAEPLSVGGGGRNALSCSQLGVHGVALVWRDPKPPKNAVDGRSGETSYNGDAAPHRTRVLFYHQFD